MKKFKYSEFPINGEEVDEYCYAFAAEYGDESNIIKAVDEEYRNAKSVDGTWCEFLNDLRKRLIERGFSEEIKKRDNDFEKMMQARLSSVNPYSGKTQREIRKNYTQLSDRMP